MLSAITLSVAAVASLLGMVGYRLRHRNPRVALFLMSLMFITWASWLLASTYELAQQDQAHTISRHNATFPKAGQESQFIFSVWFHAILGVLTLIAGFFGVIASFFKTNVRFKR